ncbi:hypothetical protein D3C78_1148970 [compost metagenome]
MGIQLRRGEALVAGEAAAVNAFGNDHVFAAFARQIDQRLTFAKVLSAAGDVHRNRRFLWCEVEAIHQVRADETHRVVEVQSNIAKVLSEP